MKHRHCFQCFKTLFIFVEYTKVQRVHMLTRERTRSQQQKQLKKWIKFQFVSSSWWHTYTHTPLGDHCWKMSASRKNISKRLNDHSSGSTFSCKYCNLFCKFASFSEISRVWVEMSGEYELTARVPCKVWSYFWLAIPMEEKKVG